MSNTVGVVIPAYDPDVDLLNTYVEEIREQDIADTIHVELDAASRSTAAALDAPDSVNAVAERRGKGAALTAGFDALSTDVLAFADADGSTPAVSLADVVTPVRDGESAVAVGSRRHPLSEIEGHQTVLRRRMGDVFAWLARRALPVSLYDYQCGAKALRADVWAEIETHVYETGFAWDLEVIGIAGALDHSVREVPVRWNDAPGSTVDPVRTPLKMAVALVAINHRLKRIQGNRLHVLPEVISTLVGEE